MANSYLESIAEARRLVQTHLGDWEAIDKKILGIVDNAQKITSVPVDSGSLKEMNSRLQEQVGLRQQLNKVVEEQGAKIKALQSQLAKLSNTEKGRSKSLSDEERQLKALAKSEERLLDVKSETWKQVEANRRAANQEAQGIRNRLSDYGQYSQQLIQMSREYKDLAIQKIRLNNLTAEEIKRMNGLETQIGQLRSQLVQVDHSVGQFGRSVGSYGKKFDSLGFSIAQITREMPAFAYGAQIGFAALSNNIPMLFDEIQKVRIETAALRAEGKATSSVLSQLGASVFGLQTLLSVAVTLLTLYGADLIEMAFGATEAEKAQKALNEAIAKGEADSRAASKEMRTYVEIVQDATASDAAREGALKALKEEVAELEGVELGQKDAMQQVIDKTGPYIIAAEARAKADAFARLAAEAEAKLIELKAKSLEDNVKWYDYVTAAVTNFGNASTGMTDVLVSGAEAHTKGIKEQEAVLDLMNSTYTEYMEQALEAESKITDKTKGSTKATREKVEALEEMNRTRRYSVEYWEQVISGLEKEQKMVARSSEDWENYAESIKKAQDAIAIIKDVQQWARDEMAMSEDEIEAFNIEVTTTLTTKGIEDGMAELEKITGETTEDLYNEMLTWYGSDWEAFLEFSEAKMRQKEIEAEKIKEVQGEIANAAVDFGSALFEAEIERIDQRIEKNKDYYAQLLAGEELTQERRAALEAERDLQERKLMKEKRKRENQQFLFEQGVALAKIAMHTAVAYTEALPNVLLSQLMLILGGIQAATVIALSIPKFKTGTNNAPEGWAIVDEVTPEVHTDKKGRVKSYGSEKGPNLRFLEQGDIIHKSRKEYFDKVGTKQIENNIWGLNRQYQGRPVPQQSVDAALLRSFLELKEENSKVWREVKKLASRAIHNNVTVELPDNRMY